MKKMNFDDYESLPNAPSLAVTMFAGASAGILEHISMYPVDTIKVASSKVNQLNNLELEKKSNAKSWEKQYIGEWKRKILYKHMPSLELMRIPPYDEFDGLCRVN